MAITFDSVSSFASGSRSLTHGAGAHGVWLIVVEGEVAGVDNVTGVTVDGNAATLVAKVQTGSNPAMFDWVYAFIYIGAGDGLAHTFNTSQSSGTPAYFVAEYLGVKQSTTPDSSGNDTGITAGGTHNVPYTTVAANAWLFYFWDITTSTTMTPGGGAVLRTGRTDVGLVDSNAGVATGSNNLSLATSGSGIYGGVLWSLAPFVAPPATAFFAAAAQQ